MGKTRKDHETMAPGPRQLPDFQGMILLELRCPALASIALAHELPSAAWTTPQVASALEERMKTLRKVKEGSPLKRKPCTGKFHEIHYQFALQIE